MQSVTAVLKLHLKEMKAKVVVFVEKKKFVTIQQLILHS